MTNEKTITTKELLETVQLKREYLFTLTQTAAELTGRAKVSSRPSELENFTASGYELHRVSELLENINFMITDMYKEIDGLIKQAMQVA